MINNFAINQRIRNCNEVKTMSSLTLSLLLIIIVS